MQSYTVRFMSTRPPAGLAGTPPAATERFAPTPNHRIPRRPHRILNEGDEAGEGLVRTCEFSVPR